MATHLQVQLACAELAVRALASLIDIFLADGVLERRQAPRLRVDQRGEDVFRAAAVEVLHALERSQDAISLLEVQSGALRRAEKRASADVRLDALEASLRDLGDAPGPGHADARRALHFADGRGRRRLERRSGHDFGQRRRRDEQRLVRIEPGQPGEQRADRDQPGERAEQQRRRRGHRGGHVRSPLGPRSVGGANQIEVVRHVGRRHGARVTAHVFASLGSIGREPGVAGRRGAPIRCDLCLGGGVRAARARDSNRSRTGWTPPATLGVRNTRSRRGSSRTADRPRPSSRTAGSMIFATTRAGGLGANGAASEGPGGALTRARGDGGESSSESHNDASGVRTLLPAGCEALAPPMEPASASVLSSILFMPGVPKLTESLHRGRLCQGHGGLLQAESTRQRGYTRRLGIETAPNRGAVHS